MKTLAQKIRVVAFWSALALVAAGMLAGTVQARTGATESALRTTGGRGNHGSYLQLGGRENTPSRCPCNAGLPEAFESGTAVQASAQTAPSSQCPCNVGLPGGPSLPRPVATGQVAAVQSGFNWADAGVGAGLVAGLGGIALGAVMFARRRHRPQTA
jgi:hypothetical protein